MFYFLKKFTFLGGCKIFEQDKPYVFHVNKACFKLGSLTPAANVMWRKKGEVRKLGWFKLHSWIRVIIITIVVAKIFMLLKVILLTFQPSVTWAEGFLTVILMIVMVSRLKSNVTMRKMLVNWLSTLFHLSKTQVELPVRTATIFEQLSENKTIEEIWNLVWSYNNC